MKPQNLDRIRFVTRHFNELKGLAFVALGLMFLALGLCRFLHRPPLLANVVFIFQISLTAGYGFLFFYSRSYYRRRFGEVEPMAGPAYRPPDALSIYRPAGAAPHASVRIKGGDPRFGGLLLLMWSLSIALYVALRMAAPRASFFDASGIVVPPFLVTTQQLIELVSGSLFLSTWLWRGRRLSQSYYLVLGVAMMVAATFSSVDLLLLEPWPPRLVKVMGLLMAASVDEWTGLLFCGICFFLAGALDHWQLVRALRPVTADGPYLQG